jgi:hypothetical protein
MMALARDPIRRWKVLIAGAAGALASFSFASGFLVGGLLAVLLWQRLRQWKPVARCLALLAWFVWVAATTLAAFSGPAPGSRHVSLSVLWDRPLMRLHFIVVLLGQMFGQGTNFEPFVLSAIAGSILLALFLFLVGSLLWRRRNQDLWDASLPGLILSLYGLCNAVLICIGRLGNSSDTFTAFNNVEALAERTDPERFITFTLYFPLGIILLLAARWRYSPEEGTFRRFSRSLAAPVIVLYVAALVLNWQQGWQLMKLENRLMAQERSMLSFGHLATPDRDRLWNIHMRGHTFDLALFLAKKGCLRCTIFPENTRIEKIAHGEIVPKNWSYMDPPVDLGQNQWQLGGMVGLPDKRASDLPELVVITSQVQGQPEQIAAIAAPWLPETFLYRRSQRLKYHRHYFGWSKIFDASNLPSGPVTLRAYAYEDDFLRVRSMEGVHTIQVSATSVKDEKKSASSIPSLPIDPIPPRR